jgi:hypothetical protein
MAANDPTLALEQRARRAYELGRIRSAIRVTPFIAAGAAVAILCGRPLALTAAVGSALLVLCVVLADAGGAAGRAVWSGLMAGVAPLAMPLFMITVGHACFGDACMRLCLPACIAGGAVAGVAVARMAARHSGDWRFVSAALAIATLTGAMGCSTAGAAGVLGMIGGFVAAGAPMLVAARR